MRIVVTMGLIVALLMPPSAFSGTAANPMKAELVVYEYEEKGSPEEMTVDLVLVRPLGLVATVCGAVVFLVATPFSAMGGNTPQAWESLVAEPARFTFQRPLGYFEENDVW